ncbi:Oxysterol-binding protein-domain-containing protein [Blakeslea trispora]|nr:Oxysterol-binding protein-domain-containing protein [Blakeslea trispora]
MPEVRVQPRSIYEHHLQIKKPNTTLKWSFSTKKNSICFGLYFKPDQFEHRASMDETSYASAPANQPNKSKKRNPSLPKLTQLLSHNTIDKQSSEDNSPLTSATINSSLCSDNEDESNGKAPVVVQSLSQTHGLTIRRKSSSAASVSNLLDNDFIELIPIEQVNSSKETIVGSFLAKSSGSYILLFDNTFSRTTPKSLFFMVTTDEPLDEDSSDDVDISGWLLKKRRKRMQGWAKRWFELSSAGVLSYSVRKGDIKRGSLQVGLATIVISPKQRTLHIDSGTTTFHIKATSTDLFEQWLSFIRARKSVSLAANNNLNPIIWDDEAVDFQSFSNFVPELAPNVCDSQLHDMHHQKISKSLIEIDAHIKHLKQLLFEDLGNLSPSDTPVHSNSIVSFKDHEKTNVSSSTSTQSAGKFIRIPFVRKTTTTQLDENQTLPYTTTYQSSTIKAINASIELIEECRDTLSDAYHELYSQKQEQDDTVAIDSLKVSSKTKAGPLSHRSVKSFYSYSMLSDQYFDAEDFFMSSDDIESVCGSVDINSDDEEDEDCCKNSVSSTHVTQKHSFDLDIDKEALTIVRREGLPHPVAVKSISFLGVLRKNIGKDLSTISMPITFNEPINLLQHLCEELEYSDLIEKAALQASSINRLMYIVLFAISGYASSQYRIGRKPFNPILFETYECIRPDKGFRFISEKVSHHPNILACHADSRIFEYSQSCSGKTKFWGKSMELISEGQCRIKLKEYGDIFTYSKPSSWLRNLVAGTKYIEHIGEMKVVNHTRGDYAIVTFKEAITPGTGFFSNLASDNSQYRNHVAIKLYNENGILLKELQGKWNESISEVVGPDQYSTLWRCKPPSIPNYHDYYGFTSFLMELNEITQLEENKIPITDTRNRPDQRLFEEGKVSEAESEKERIEQLQRERRKQTELSGESCQPLWFELKKDDLSSNGEFWQYKGGYWEARSKRQWPDEILQLW